jgi:arsenite methyltransferase
MLNHYFIRLAFMESWKNILLPNQVQVIFDKVEERLNQHTAIFEGFRHSIPFVVVNAQKCQVIQGCCQ